MKWVLSIAVLLTGILTAQPRASFHGPGRGSGRGPHGGPHFGQGHRGHHGHFAGRRGGYSHHWGFRGYPGGYRHGYGFGGYTPYHFGYSRLYPYGIYHRPFPYLSSYYGGYPYSYGYGSGSSPYTMYPPAGQGAYGPQVVKVYEFPKASNDLDDVDKTWAWGYLAEGNFGRASAIFEAMERQTPAAGWPKIGNGLLAGFSGDYGKAVYQFRRAFRFDASDPGRLPAEQELDEKVQRLAAHFKREANAGRKPDPDAEFMIAVLSFLSGDPVGAQNAVEKAVLHGDKSRSTRNLKELVDGALEQRNHELLAAQEQF